MVMRTVPEDVITDILLRLPIKALVRFRLVSKSWSALLKSPDFATTHLKNSAHHGRRLLVNSQRENDTMSLISSEALDVEAKIESPGKGKAGVIVGSCNGLVCLIQDRVILLWNPATREHKILPTPRTDSMFPNSSASIGFGFHLNDYKVVRILYSRGMDGRQVPPLVELYSTSAGSWRVIDAVVPFVIEQRKCSVILKGVPYWLGFGPFWPNTRFGPGVPRRDEFVLSFDMGKEVFRQVHVPDAQGSYYNYSKKLGAFNESLAIIYYPCYEQLNNFIEFWVMEDHGVDESWSKVLRIGPFSSIGIPLGCWKDGVVVWQNRDDELSLYDPNIKAVKKLSTLGAPKFSTSVSTYMESLVPVNEGRREL